MKPFFYLIIGLSVFFTVAAGIVAGLTEAFSFFIGALVAIFNVGFLTLLTQRIFKKKSVATTLLLIIFKYTILGIFLFLLITYQLVMLLWFVIGLSILFPTVIGYIVIFIQQNRVKSSFDRNKDKDEYGSF